ncbi:glutathione S-transferase family protein [Acuticoccus sp. MNP-M23]|uniref:glutathione S-transferase family protein n=1 Tax=Acuticoccus sp. MNP-M23 TaxID=3072793 RepID=UPI002814D1AA|nr:glutathione S-transferase family protein [Acuticoccus sp. MNP-M23]WMS41286.1 glutathione S-transferase family protein [Acuticoccus sp. MNP-M23]
MKLYTAGASPFGRTVELVAYELGLHEDIEIIATKVAPTTANKDYQATFPLRKIPALVTEEGVVLGESGLIAQYLAARVGDTHLFAQNAPEHWQVLSDYMLAKGMADCAVGCRYELAVRPEEKRWQPWVDDQLDKIDAGLAHFAKTPPTTEGRLTIAAIALGATLGYLDFRFDGIVDWRGKYPALVAWAEPLFARPSFAATMPG